MGARVRRVALVGASGPVPMDRLECGRRILHDLGCTTEVFIPPEPHGYLAGTDQERWDALMAAVAGDFDLVMAARGGYGAARLLPRLLPPPGRPGRFLGFSDVTPFLYWLGRSWGWSVFHGPNGTTLDSLDSGSMDSFVGLIEDPDGFSVKEPIEIIAGTEASGPLLGGNLATLCSLLGTEFEPDLSGSLLLLEDVNEPAYSLDRFLVQLSRCRSFPRVKGVLVGDLGADLEEVLKQTLLEICREHGILLALGLPSGHERCNHCLPLGIRARAARGFLEIRPS